jgi:cellulose synthase operon protein YhjQ
MSDRKAHFDQNDTPEDVATLYSWANLHGAKYRDFSASRALTREKARQRAQEAQDAQGAIAGHEYLESPLPDADESVIAADAERAAEAARAAEAVREGEIIRQRAAQQAEMAARRTARQVIQQSSWQPPERQQAFAAGGSQQDARDYAPYNPQRTTSPPAFSRNAPREEQTFAPRVSQPPAEPREDFSRPAWLSQQRSDVASYPVPQAPPDTIQGSRDRLTSRWFALKGVFESPAHTFPEPQPASAPARVPVVAVFSLAGGVGKSSLVATLARTLSARGERLLLVDTSSFGVLPFYFGARDQRPGVRTFTPPEQTGNAPIQTLSIDPETLESESANPDLLTQEIFRQAHSANRVLVDIATASGPITRRMLRVAPLVIVPVIPDMTSVVSVGAIDGFFRQHPSASGRLVQPFYLLNQFDHTLPLHLDVREVLREQLGERLLPFVMRRSSAVSEALAEGMTVMDYAPTSTLAEDFNALAGWIKNIAAPASSGYRGVRWSEK